MDDISILPHHGHMPRIAPSAYIAPGSRVIGDVVVGAQASLWFNCVVRGDVNFIRIGPRSNIQDGTVIHTSSEDGATIIGAGVVVGHMCLLHACRLEDGCLVGMGATVMDHAVIESGGWVGAGALVTEGKRVKSGELWLGQPAKFKRMLRPDETEHIARIAGNYVTRINEYRDANPR